MKLNWTMAISGFIGCLLTLLLLSPAHCQQSMLGPWQIDIKGKITAGLKYDFVNWTLKYQDIFYATTEEQYYNTTVYYDENNPSYSIMVMWDSRGHDTVILDMSFYDPEKGIYYVCYFDGAKDSMAGPGWATAYMGMYFLDIDTGEQTYDVDATQIPIKCKMQRVK